MWELVKYETKINDQEKLMTDDDDAVDDGGGEEDNQLLNRSMWTIFNIDNIVVANII